MTVRPCLPWPDARLRRKADLVDEITDELRIIWRDMIDTMDAMPGVGLAAAQIGCPLALAVVDASEGRGQAVCMANPRVLHASVQLRSHEEASPNLPGISATLKRPRAVTVEFLGQDGRVQTQDFVGLWATSVQHQIDHLDGKLFIHRLSKVKRDMLLRRYEKLRGAVGG